jgi:hypothetical protein
MMLRSRLARVGVALLHEVRVRHIVSQRGWPAGVAIGVPAWEAARYAERPGFLHSVGSMRSFASTPSRSTAPATTIAGVPDARQRQAARYEGPTSPSAHPSARRRSA